MTTTDKSKQLSTSLELINDRLNFNGFAGENPPVPIDYIPPLGDNLGYTSLELLLLSFSSCVGSAMLIFLRRMKKTLAGFKIHSTGIRHEMHPTGFRNIVLDIHLKSPDTTEEELRNILTLAEDTYCPVWAMIRGNVEVEVRLHIEAPVQV